MGNRHGNMPMDNLENRRLPAESCTGLIVFWKAKYPFIIDDQYLVNQSIRIQLQLVNIQVRIAFPNPG